MHDPKLLNTNDGIGIKSDLTWVLQQNNQYKQKSRNFYVKNHRMLRTRGVYENNK